MKVKFSQFVFALLICFSFCSFAFGQTIPVALKFDEFDDSSDNQFYPYEEINLSQRIERLVRQVKKQRRVKVYVIYYLARQINSGEIYKISNWADHTAGEVAHRANLDFENVIKIDGGYREKNTLEYWIAPKNAEPPTPTPTFDKSEAFVCPKIYVYGDARSFGETKAVYFSSDSGKEATTFQWKVSAGEIVQGQGTRSIAVDLKNTSDKHITAFAEVEGLPQPCPKTGYATVDVNVKIYPFTSSVRYNFSELSAILDAFMVELNSNPTLKGHISIYASRSGGIREMERSIRSVKTAFAFRKYDLSRVNIVRSGYREYNTVDLWVLPEGAAPPTPTPTVDEKFINVPAPKKKSRRRK